MKHVENFESFLSEGFFVDNLEEKIKEIVFRILKELGYRKRERFMTINLGYSGGMYNIFLNGEQLAKFLKYTIEYNQPSGEIESTIKKAIIADPKKFGF